MGAGNGRLRSATVSAFMRTRVHALAPPGWRSKHGCTQLPKPAHWQPPRHIDWRPPKLVNCSKARGLHPSPPIAPKRIDCPKARHNPPSDWQRAKRAGVPPPPLLSALATHECLDWQPWTPGTAAVNGGWEWVLHKHTTPQKHLRGPSWTLAAVTHGPSDREVWVLGMAARNLPCRRLCLLACTRSHHLHLA